MARGMGQSLRTTHCPTRAQRVESCSERRRLRVNPPMAAYHLAESSKVLSGRATLISVILDAYSPDPRSSEG